MNIQNARDYGRATLANISSAALDTDLLLMHVLGCPRTELITRHKQLLSCDSEHRFRALVGRRQQHQPVAQLTGRKAFWDFELAVNEHVLIPRPETELLVQTLLERVRSPSAKVIDLGTGSGAIAIAVARARPGWQVLATDTSHAALATARCNARDLAPHVMFLRGDWLDALADDSIDAVAANPPYVDPAYAAPPDLAFEPATALRSGEHGMSDLRRIIAAASRVVRANGGVYLEHGHDQAEHVRAAMAAAGLVGVDTLIDLGGQPRVTCGTRP